MSTEQDLAAHVKRRAANFRKLLEKHYAGDVGNYAQALRNLLTDAQHFCVDHFDNTLDFTVVSEEANDAYNAELTELNK